MNTQILSLKEPYEYICCNGSIALHIATMIVYETGTNEDGDYELVTHSHPVVKYYNRPSGTVWNRAELTDCTVLCREDNKRITMEQFYNFVSDACQMDDSSSEGPTLPTVDLVVSKEKLRRNGIEIEWPMVRSEKGNMVPQKEFDIALVFEQNGEDGSDYSCYDMGLSDKDIHAGAAPLSVFFNFKNKKELKAQLIYVMGAYYAMFKGHDFHIQFYWPEGSEFADVVNEVNQKETEIRRGAMTSTYDFLGVEALSHLNSVKGIVEHLEERARAGDEDARRVLDSLGITLKEFKFTGSPATGKNMNPERGRKSHAGERVTKAFKYNVRDTRLANTRLTMFYNALLAFGWIREDTPLQTFVDLFGGGDCSQRIVWMDDVNTLAELFRRLVSVKLVAVQSPYGLWQMVDGHFWEKEGNKAFGNERLRKTHTPQEKSRHIDCLLKIMDPRLSEEKLKRMMMGEIPEKDEELLT